MLHRYHLNLLHVLEYQKMQKENRINYRKAQRFPETINASNPIFFLKKIYITLTFSKV